MKLIKLFALACVTLFTCVVHADDRAEIDAGINSTLETFEATYPAIAPVFREAKGYLVFPTVYKAGIGIGGSYGEGALVVNGQNVQYYSIASASVGFQFGAQSQSQIILFMTEDALTEFRNSQGWKAGVDGSIAIATIGAGGVVDTNTLNQPRIGFIFSNKGLMYNATLEGSKLTKIVR